MLIIYVCLFLILFFFYFIIVNFCLVMIIYCVFCCNLLCFICRKFVEKIYDENYFIYCMEFYLIMEKRVCCKYGEVMWKESIEKLIS